MRNENMKQLARPKPQQKPTKRCPCGRYPAESCVPLPMCAGEGEV